MKFNALNFELELLSVKYCLSTYTSVKHNYLDWFDFTLSDNLLISQILEVLFFRNSRLHILIIALYTYHCIPIKYLSSTRQDNFNVIWILIQLISIPSVEPVKNTRGWLFGSRSEIGLFNYNKVFYNVSEIWQFSPWSNSQLKASKEKCLKSQKLVFKIISRS